MPTATPVARARSVLTSNRYFALATVDENGPWVATLAYTIVARNSLCFFSEATSRHGMALKNGGPVAGVIYDSTCSAANAESLQFSGRGEVVRDRDSIARVLRVAAERGGSNPPSEQIIEAHAARTSTLLYRIIVEETFVLDQNLFEQKGVDGRERVAVEHVFAGLG